MHRPPEWENWTKEQKMEWLRKQRSQYKGGRKRSLKPKDKQNVWGLMKKYQNKSLVAELLGVSRRTVIRFLDRHPIPKTFVVEEGTDLYDFPEMQTWLNYITGSAGNKTISRYRVEQKAFYEWMKKFHPERAKPSLWTSEDILQYLYGKPPMEGWTGLEPYQWHTAIVPLRSLKHKAPDEFPHIKLGLLPTKKTHKAKRSLAGKEKYYLSPEQVARMIEVATTKKAKAMIAFFYNTACRIEALINMRVENLHLKDHWAEIKDKGAIVWMVYGLTKKTIQLLAEYIEERGYPKTGWLFANGNDKKMTKKQVNDIIRETGAKAEITGKVLTSKTFRKSFVKNALDIAGINPLVLAGTGKETKTAFCVGWTLDVVMKHYAPKMKGQIETARTQFLF